MTRAGKATNSLLSEVPCYTPVQSFSSGMTMQSTFLLYAAATAAISIGLVHSVLGEKYILIRLFKQGQLPRLFGGTEFTQRTLRFAWHITTIAWWGFAALLLLAANNAISFHSVLWVVSATFLITAVMAFAGSRGRHLAWIVFLFIGLTCLIAI